METSPAPWITALRHSHDALRVMAGPLGPGQLKERSYADLPELRLPAEAFIRLLYGRLDPAHTPPVDSRGADLDGLRRIFPGF